MLTIDCSAVICTGRCFVWTGRWRIFANSCTVKYFSER